MWNDLLALLISLSKSPFAQSTLSSPLFAKKEEKSGEKMFRHKKSQNYGRPMPQKITDQNDKKSRIKQLYKVICFKSFFKLLLKHENGESLPDVS